MICPSTLVEEMKKNINVIFSNFNFNVCCFVSCGCESQASMWHVEICNIIFSFHPSLLVKQPQILVSNDIKHVELFIVNFFYV
jgi:hypothetical protein